MNQLYPWPCVLPAFKFVRMFTFLVGDGWYAPTCKRCHNTPGFVPRSRSVAGGGRKPATSWL